MVAKMNQSPRSVAIPDQPEESRSKSLAIAPANRESSLEDETARIHRLQGYTPGKLLSK